MLDFLKKNLINIVNFSSLFHKPKTETQSNDPVFPIYLQRFRGNRFYTDNLPPAIQKSGLEKFFHMNAENSAEPHIINEDEDGRSESFLPALSTESWPSFLKNSTGNVNITLGWRRAFTPSLNLPLSHAVLLVSDVSDESRHAMYSYSREINEETDTQPMIRRFYNNFFGSSSNSDYLQNETKLHDISKKYCFYGLSIEGTPEQAAALFTNFETSAKEMWYTGYTNNCYTPVVKNLIEAENLGLQVPPNFRQRLLTVLPLDHNHGMGTATNSFLRHIIEETQSLNMTK